MNSTGQANSSKRHTANGTVCPGCAAAVAADANRCSACGFTGADTMRMFPHAPPPLLTVLDAAGLWKEADVRAIEAARERLRRRFPQFLFHVCTVALPAATSLPAFGFWMLNVAPFDVNETADERAWAVLLVIDAASGKAAVVLGYSAERWLEDASWIKALASMSPHWKAGRTAAAVIRFFETSGSLLDQSWRARGLRRSKRYAS